MSGLIRAEDIAAVKDKVSIDSIVRQYVSLRPAGVGSLKGLCPFHDEKTPSFTVRPAVGSYHCFGCGEGGDVIAFLQGVEHLTFTEAVERLARDAGIELRTEAGDGGSRGMQSGTRARLIEAHRAAAEYYQAELFDNSQARIARDFLRERDFNGEVARLFGVGFAPTDGSALVSSLKSKGFSDDELILGGLAGRGRYGLYDRFRGRLVWPIRTITGDTVGFGARRLFDDDRIEAKYLNTAETPIYKKSTVLYGLDRAKQAIARDRRVVVVEGYTDVMAAQLSGVEDAVATCGTAFGVDHIKVLRRILRDEADLSPAKVVYTFDGDQAGQKAAMRAFGEDQRWAAQSYVAVAADGMDPCDLRLRSGPDAVKALVEGAIPMFEFAVHTVIDRFDLETAEGRVAATRAVAPTIKAVKDPALRPEYVRTVAGWIGMEIEQVAAAVDRASAATPAPERRGEPAPSAAVDQPLPTAPIPDLRDPVVRAERQLLQCLLQYPELVDAATIAELPVEAFVAPAHRAVFDGVRSAAPLGGRSTAAWVDAVTQAAALAVRGLVGELSVAELPTRMDKETGAPPRRYVESLVVGIHDVALGRRIADIASAHRRHESSGDLEAARATASQLQDLQRQRIAWREKLS